MRLFDLTDDYRQIADLLCCDDLSDEERQEACERLDAINASLEDKGEAILCVLLEMDGSIKAGKEVLGRIKRTVAAREKAYERLKNYTLHHLQNAGLKKLTTPLGTLAVRDSPVSVSFVGNLECIPEDYRRVTVEPDIQKAREFLKQNGSLPPGFDFSQGTHLRIQ
jgi:hypothetical protein